jgi:hypothetical protein
VASKIATRCQKALFAAASVIKAFSLVVFQSIQLTLDVKFFKKNTVNLSARKMDKINNEELDLGPGICMGI